MSTGLALCGIGRTMFGLYGLLWAHSPLSFLDDLGEFVPGVLAALALLTVVAVVGHVLWLAASAVFHLVFDRSAPEKPLSPERSQCVFCGRVIGKGDRRCAYCGRDLLGTAAEEWNDLKAVFRQLKRWQRTGRISEAEQVRWHQWLEARRRELLAEGRGESAAPSAVPQPFAEDRTQKEQPSPDHSQHEGQEGGEEIVVAEIVPDEQVPAPGQASPPTGASKRPSVPPLRVEPLTTGDSQRGSPRTTEGYDTLPGVEERSATETPVEPATARTWVDWFSGFLEQRNIRWGEVIGAVLMVGSAVALVISLWQTLQEIRYFPFFFSAGLVAAIFGAGLYAHQRWRLEATSCGLLGVATLLTPLAFVALAGPLFEAAQPDYTAMGLSLAVAAVLAVLLARSGAVLAPGVRRPLTWGVIGNSLWIVFSSAWPKLADQPAWSAGWNDPYWAAAVVASGLFLSALGWAAAIAARRRLLRSEGVSLLNMLGLSVFTLIVTHGVLLARCESVAALAEALRLLAPLATVSAGACLATAVAVYRAGRSGRASALVGIVAQVVGYSSGAVMLLGVAAAWPQPADMIAVAAFNAVVLAAVAIGLRVPLLIVPAMLCTAWAALLLFHLWDGRPPLPWRLGPEMTFDPHAQPRDLIGELQIELLLLPWRARSVLVWIGLQAAFLAMAEAVGRWRRAAAAHRLRRGAVVAMALALAIGLYESLRFGDDQVLSVGAMLAAALLVAPAAVRGADRSLGIFHQLGLLAAAIGGVCWLAVDRGWASDPADLMRPICLHAFATAFGLLGAVWIALEWIAGRPDWMPRLLEPRESGNDRPSPERATQPAFVAENIAHGLISPLPSMRQMLARAPSFLGDTPLARWLPHVVVTAAAALCAASIATSAWVEWFEPRAAVDRWAADGYAVIRAEFFGATALWPLAVWAVLFGVRRALRFGPLDAVAVVVLVGMTVTAAAVWTGDPPDADAQTASADAPPASTSTNSEPSATAPAATASQSDPLSRSDGPQEASGDLPSRFRSPMLPAVMPAWAWSMGLGFAALAAICTLWNDRRLTGRWLRRPPTYSMSGRIEKVFWWSAVFVLAVPAAVTALLVALNHLLGDQATPVPPVIHRVFGDYFSVGVVAVPWALLSAGTAAAAWRWRRDSIGGVAGLLVQIGIVLGYLAQRVAVAAHPFTWTTATNALLLAVSAGAIWCLVSVAVSWAALRRIEARGWNGRSNSAGMIGFGVWTLLLFAVSIGVRVGLVLADRGPVPVAWLDITAFAAVALAAATVAARHGASALAAVGYYAALTTLSMTMTARTAIGELFVWKFCGALAAFVLAMAISGWVARCRPVSQWFASLDLVLRRFAATRTASQAADPAACSTADSMGDSRGDSITAESPGLASARTKAAADAAKGAGVALGESEWFTASQALWALLAAAPAAAVAWEPRFDLLEGAQGIAGFDGRLAGVGAALILAAAAILMSWASAGTHRLWWQVAAVASVVLTTTCFGWARLPVEPESIEAAAPRLHRLAVLLLTTMLMSCASWFFSRMENRRPAWIDPWTAAARTALPGVATIAAAGLLLVVCGEFILWWKTGLVPMAVWASLTVTAALLAAAIAAVAWAVASGDHRSVDKGTAAVYAAEAIIGLLGIHLYWSMPWLFSSGLVRQYWMAIVVVAAMVGAALAELFARRGLAVLSGPLERTAMLAPLVPALAFWRGQSWGVETYYLGGASPVIWFMMGGFYTVLAARRGSLWLSAAAVVTGTAGLWVLWHGFDWRFARHPQVWLIPPGIMLLAVARLQRGRLTDAGRASLRYLALTVIYGSSLVEFWRLVDTSLAPALITIGLCIAGVLLGIWLHLRSFLAVASGCLLLALARLLYYAAFEQGRMWLFWGCCLLAGAGMIALFALFERRREQFAAAVDRVRQWDD